MGHEHSRPTCKVVRWLTKAGWLAVRRGTCIHDTNTFNCGMGMSIKIIKKQLAHSNIKC